MKVAVVIPALHEADRIQDAIQSAQAPEVEVLVVDGGSRDQTRARALEAGARVIDAEAGRAIQLAAGAEAVRCEAILFLHADSLLPAGYAGAVREALADPRVAGGAFALRFDVQSPGLRFLEWGVRVRLFLTRLPYGDQAIFLRRRVLEGMGGVPRVPIMEDLDLVAGIKRAGRLVLLPLAVTTSARRYQERGVWRGFLRNALALIAWRIGLDRRRVAGWYGR